MKNPHFTDLFALTPPGEIHLPKSHHPAFPQLVKRLERRHGNPAIRYFTEPVDLHPDAFRQTFRNVQVTTAAPQCQHYHRPTSPTPPTGQNSKPQTREPVNHLT